MLLLPCYYHAVGTMLFAAVGVQLLKKGCGEESADGAVTMLLMQLLGVDVRERDCGDESADGAVPMLFAAVGGRCSGARLRR